MKGKTNETAAGIACSVAALMASVGISLAAGAAALNIDAAILWLGEATGYDLLVRFWMFINQAQAAVVRLGARIFGGPEIAKAVSFYVSFGFALFVGFFAYRKVKLPVQAYFALRMRIGDLDETSKVAGIRDIEN